MQRLATARVAAATTLLATETALADAERQVAELARRRDAADAQLAADSRALQPLLPVLERLSMYPVESLLAVPASPRDAVRGLLILRGVVRQLRAQSVQVAAEQASVSALQAKLDGALPQLREAEQRQRAEAAALDEQLAQARAAGLLAQAAAQEAARRAAAEAARATTLRRAIATLAAAASRAAAPPPAAPPPPAASPVARRDGWALPVAGRVVRGFGALGEAGAASGITLQTPPGARVVSPCAGRVAFAAPFRSYGPLVIVDCGVATVVLSGLARLDALAGQTVQAGEPVGVMPPAAARLYLELRRGGDPVDPAPYLRTAS